MLGLLLAALVFTPIALGGVRPSEVILMQWLLLGFIALWLVRLWISPKFRFLWPPICWAVLPFLAYAGWRYATADIEYVARQEWLQVLMLGILFLGIVNGLYGQESQRIIVFTLIGVATVISMYGIYQWLSGSDRVLAFTRPPTYHNRASGTYICPNHFAGLLEMALPLALALSFSGRINAVARVVLGYAALVMLAGIAGSLSRGAWMSAILALLVYFSLLARRRAYRWIAIALLALVCFGGVWTYSKSIARQRTAVAISGHHRDVRLRFWSAAWEMWRENPWWGVGPDHFDHRYRAFRDPVDKTQARPGRAHNDYLNTLADYGVAGLVLLMLPIGAGIWGLFRCWPYVKRNAGEFGGKGSNRSAIVLGCALGLLAMLVHSFFDFNMHVPANAMVAVTLLAILSTHLRFATDRYWFTARWPLKIIGTILLSAAIVYLGRQTLTHTREAVWLKRARSAPEASARQIAAFRQAAEIEPKNPATTYELGERLRLLAWQGQDGYRQLTREAMPWFERTWQLNPWDPFSRIRYGMCLDWLGEHDKARPFYEKALELDPNHYYTRVMLGWHHFQAGDFEAAREWNRKSLQVNWTTNPQGYAYYELINRAIATEGAKNRANPDQ